MINRDGTGYENFFKFITNKGTCIDYRNNKKRKSEFVRYYFLSEIKRMLNLTGFKSVQVFGSTDLPIVKYTKDSECMNISAEKL